MQKTQESFMEKNKAMFTSDKTDWETPQDFYDKLNAEFNFDLDACASPNNTKCSNYYTIQQDGLSQDWGGHTVFCNPPYGKILTRQWVKKCYEEAQKPNTIVVALVPARTDTYFFHDYIYNKPNVEVRFIKGRLKFSNAKDAAPFPSMVAIFR